MAVTHSCRPSCALYAVEIELLMTTCAPFAVPIEVPTISENIKEFTSLINIVNVFQMNVVFRNNTMEFCIEIMYLLTSDFFACSLNGFELLCLKVRIAMKESFGSVRPKRRSKFGIRGDVCFPKLFCHFTNK